jgi:hypothetical protein
MNQCDDRREAIYGSFLTLVQEMRPGEAKSNKRARQELALSDTDDLDREAYWSARDELIDEGWVEKIRAGNGGSFRRLAVTEDIPDSSVASDPDLPRYTTDEGTERFEREVELYPFIKEILETEWSRDERAAPVFIEQTAFQGPRAVNEYSNKWVRPDLTALLINDLRNIVQKELEVVTFEVKGWFDRTGIYEALSHSRRAHRSYVLVYEPNREDSGAEFCREAAEVGVGVIVARKIDQYGEWEEKIPAESKKPDLHLIDGFLASFISHETRNAVREALLN